MQRYSAGIASRIRFLWLAVCACCLLTAAARAQTVGETLPPWTPGGLDIHHINTGLGESSLFIFPDGTTMLVDAGVAGRSSRVAPPRPDDSRPAGEWIARYIRRMLPEKVDPKLDYFLLTHFHGDHMGGITTESATSKRGPYRLSGVTRVGDEIPFRTVLDRGWPEYDYPSPMNGETMDNYRAFLKWHMENDGMKVERFQPGRNDQIVLLKAPEKFPDFEVHNIASNGEVWTGEGTATKKHVPPLDEIASGDKPSENMCCNVFRLRYGAFDYYNGADICGVPPEGAPEWQDIETPVARVVGPVDVHVLDHHGYIDSTNAFFLKTLQPRVHILLTWSPSHPGPRVLARLFSKRIYPGPRDVFATNVMEATRTVIGSRLDNLKSGQGHIVVRVEPGGEQYHVIILDDSAETYKVTAVHGPYESQ